MVDTVYGKINIDSIPFLSPWEGVTQADLIILVSPSIIWVL